MQIFTRARGMSLALLLIVPRATMAQSFDTVGTRAQGMGGAFVGVANDASAVYWNPGGLAKGAYFSLTLDGSRTEGTLDGNLTAGRQSGWLLALSTPALGLSYYRLRTAAVRPDLAQPDSGTFLLDSLVTHHAGITLVQSLTDALAVGVTGKVVRGLAASVSAPADRAEDLLDGWDVMGRSGNKLDLDVGIMANASWGSAGLTVRNVAEPSFKTGGDSELQLDRQVRGGASVLLLESWKLAADLDLTKNIGPLGAVRQLAIGTEAQVARRLIARGGLRLNTTGARGRTPAVSVGGSYAVLGAVQIDAQATAGSDETLRGWGIGGRIVF